MVKRAIELIEKTIKNFNFHSKVMLEKKSDLNIESVHRLGHVAIRVDDVDRAKSFYLKLGMKLVWDDLDWCYLETGDNID